MRTNGKSALLDRAAIQGVTGRPLSLVRYEPSLASEWDEFVSRSKNGTLFHERRFLSYNAAERFEDCSFMAYDGDRLIAVYPGAVQIRGTARWWFSHPGATYGGPVLASDVGLDQVAHVLGSLIETGKDTGFEGMEMRLSEQAFRARPSDEIEFALWRSGFEIKAAELSTAIPLMADYEAIAASYREDTGRNVRKAAKSGVVV